MISDTKPSKLLWLDLEMTGLNPIEDLILEVAVIITDYNFSEITEYTAKVKNKTDELLKQFNNNNWWQDYPDNKKIFLEESVKGKSLDQIETELLEVINQTANDETIYLAGNSIHSDRKFIVRYLPKLDQRLHYRMLDVSSFKILMSGKYQVEFSKINNHRAILDVKDSINELKYYLDWLLVHKND